MKVFRALAGRTSWDGEWNGADGRDRTGDLSLTVYPDFRVETRFGDRAFA